jgi:hypothetical protein
MKSDARTNSEMAKSGDLDSPKSPARRRFLRGIGAAGAAMITAAATCTAREAPAVMAMT